MKRFAKLRIRRQHIITALLVAAVVYVAISTLSVIARNYQLQQQVDNLRSQNQILELENQKLRFEITYYQTDAFVEKEARAKLGLQAPGETTVIFPDKIPGMAEVPEPEPEPTFDEVIVSNFKQWVFFLFRVDLN